MSAPTVFVSVLNSDAFAFVSALAFGLLVAAFILYLTLSYVRSAAEYYNGDD